MRNDQHGETKKQMQPGEGPMWRGSASADQLIAVNMLRLALYIMTPAAGTRLECGSWRSPSSLKCMQGR